MQTNLRIIFKCAFVKSSCLGHKTVPLSKYRKLETKRLYFIDAVRAFAILMMLQGHFIDTLLAVEFRDTSYLAYNIWHYFRGITAPTFFSISGLIFTYLMLKSNNNGKNTRIKKGLFRGLMLIGIGYLLRIPVFRWLSGIFGTYFMVIDVLQCIGLSLIFIVFFYKLSQKNTTFFSVVMLGTGSLVFLCEPLYRSYTADGIPLFFANYITKDNGSIFTILPWFGYMAYGAFIGTLFYRYLKYEVFKKNIIVGFVMIGLALVYGSTSLFQIIFNWSDVYLFSNIANFNYLFIRLGNVLILFGIFYAFEGYLKHPVILKIGQRTLSIYVIHFIILYGSFTGWGLNRILGRSLNPKQAIFGALAFLIAISLMAMFRTQVADFLRLKITKLLELRKKSNN